MDLDWTGVAHADLRRIYEFNARRGGEWAERVEERLVQGCGLLRSHPFAGRPTASPGIRLWSMVDIQYVVSYRVDDDAISILRIHHSREDREEP